MLLGFHFFCKLLDKKVKCSGYIVFAACGTAVMHFIPAGRIAELGAYVPLLAASGIFLCRRNWKELFSPCRKLRHKAHAFISLRRELAESAKRSLLYAAVAAEVMQLLGMASLFCILPIYKKLLQNFRLSTELSLMEQEEHSLKQYVEEARTRYEKTKSFRHDIKNHMLVVKELLQSGKTEQALHYMGDIEHMAEELSFPCSTNNPVVDILAGNKLGIAKNMGIDVCCSLLLPYPCGLRDIDICIILSNALDNAIHACKNIEEGGDKYIHVSGRVQGDFILIEVENSYEGNGMVQTGTGLSNIKAAAEKYHRAMSTKTEGKVFALHVLLVIPQHSEGILRQTDSSSVSGGRKE